MPTGPLTVNVDNVALGLAQIRVGASAANIATLAPVLSASASIGALANTKYTGSTEFWKLMSGFPLMEDKVIPLSVAAAMSAAFKELTPYNLALARGIDPTGGGYTDPAVGVVNLGSLVAPAYVRMEAVYTFPDGVNTMTYIFPRAQVAASMELDHQEQDAAASPIVFEAKRADSGVVGGHSVWDTAPLGRIVFSSGGSILITSLLPEDGDIAGGTTCVLQGHGFTGASGVTFGGEAATDLNVINDGLATCVTPARTAGAKDVVITVGVATYTLVGGFTYTDLL